MRIVSITPMVCNARMRNWIFIKITTSEPGLVGWGEATLEWHTHSVLGAIKDLESLLVGEDPRRIEHLWQMMYRQHFWHGNGVIRATAMSGIDIALWDILGKVAGSPAISCLAGESVTTLEPTATLAGVTWRTSTAPHPQITVVLPSWHKKLLMKVSPP